MYVYASDMIELEYEQKMFYLTFNILHIYMLYIILFHILFYFTFKRKQNDK